MLAPRRASSAATSASAPGTSRTSTRRRTSRPDLTMPRSMISASTNGSMLPPQRTRPTFFPAKRAGAFDDRLFDLEQHQDRLLDVIFGDQDDVVDEGADDGQRQRPGRLDADA